MFGRKGKVTITDAGVTVMGDVTIDDQRSRVVLKPGQEVFPSANWARWRRWWVVEANPGKDGISARSDDGTVAYFIKSNLMTEPKLYPTAEEARNIEPEIREDLVEECLNKTLDRIVSSAKRGGTFAVINRSNRDTDLNTNEVQLLHQKLKSLGYKTGITTVEW